MRILVASLFSASLALLPSPARASLSFGQLDSFQGGSTLGWTQGASSPTPTSVIASGGPNGAGDAYLQNVSSGTFGAGSKQIMFNDNQWAGNYLQAGVTRITAEVADFGPGPVFMRLATKDGNGTEFGSSFNLGLSANGSWQALTFDLTSTGLSLVSGSDSLSTALSDVTELRLLSASAGPAFNGDTVAATVGFDDIRAMTIPGDANHDGTVNFSDLVALASHYGKISGAKWEDGDFNFDGSVNFSDLVLLASNYNSHVALNATGDLAPVPEPLGGPLLAGLLAPILCRRRRFAKPPPVS